MNLKDLGEFGLIARLRARWPQMSGAVVVGPGDDTAAIRPEPGHLLLFTVDAMVEDVHFRRRWMAPNDLGWKAMAQNISDIAAMGGQPTQALVCLSLPGDLDSQFVDKLYDGLDAAASEYGASIIGGDIVGSTGGVMVSVSLLGEVEEALLMRRSGAQPGDVLMVTGALGDAAAGLRILEAERSPGEDKEDAVVKHLRPVPRLNEARILARGGHVTAAIDVSDGLAGDARHIAEESGVGVRLYADRVPIGAACAAAAKRLDVDPLDLALRGGEDYELLVAVRPDEAERLAEFLHHETAVPLTAVGEVVDAEQGETLVRSDGDEMPLAGAFDHFSQSRG
ncbi:MAG: thiamine-phosphate kinase [Armatimonadota bacterium]|nr:MAG: thiamine-phosphate kinase [Armatimonadota bacterium]